MKAYSDALRAKKILEVVDRVMSNFDAAKTFGVSRSSVN